MFWGVLIASVIIVVLLTVLGAAISRRAPGTNWQRHEDTPMGPFDH